MTDDTDRVTIERPNDHLERIEVTEQIDDVTIHIIEGDREKTFDSETIIQADEVYADGGEFVVTEVVFESYPDLMRGLRGALIDYSDGVCESGPVPWATMSGGQTMLVIEAGRIHIPK